jgi:hypothetical protein
MVAPQQHEQPEEHVTLQTSKTSQSERANSCPHIISARENCSAGGDERGNIGEGGGAKAVDCRGGCRASAEDNAHAHELRFQGVTRARNSRCRFAKAAAAAARPHALQALEGGRQEGDDLAQLIGISGRSGHARVSTTATKGVNAAQESCVEATSQMPLMRALQPSQSQQGGSALVILQDDDESVALACARRDDS